MDNPTTNQTELNGELNSLLMEARSIQSDITNIDTDINKTLTEINTDVDETIASMENGFKALDKAEKEAGDSIDELILEQVSELSEEID